MRHFILTLLIVSVSPIFTAAQEFDFMKAMRSDMNRRYHMNENRSQYWAMWDGNGASRSMQPFVFRDEFRQGLGLTDEQHEQLTFMYSKNGTMGHWYRSKAQTNPELAALLEESDRYNATRRDDPYGEKLTEKDIQARLDNLAKSSAIYRAETQKDVENLLTPEQMQAVKEYELAMIGEVPILNPSMFGSLGLTDEQKIQMETLKRELEPDFGKIVEEFVVAEDAIQQWKFDMFEEIGLKFDENGRLVDENGKSLENDPEAAKKKMELMEKKFAENVEMRTRMEKLSERASGFMRGFQFKMLDVLTDEQLLKMQQIIANPPEYVKKVRNKLQTERAERQKQSKDNWQPGPNSWQPGDPIPVEYIEQRQQRKNFPRPTPSDAKI